MPPAVGRPNYAWSGIVGVDLSELGRIDHDSARDGRRDHLPFHYLERCAAVPEMPNALQRAELPTALNQLRADMAQIFVVSQGENVERIDRL